MEGVTIAALDMCEEKDKGDGMVEIDGETVITVKDQ